MRILLIEDDTTTADFISRSLKEAGHNVQHCTDGKDGLLTALDSPFELMIVDRMLPSLDGLSIIRSVRGADNNIPILVLSALGEVDSRVEGLQAGADDYLAKPFACSELLARIDALARRGGGAQEATRFTLDDLEIDLLSHEVRRAGKLIPMQAREFRLLEYLMRHQGQVLTRTMLLENVWDYHFDPQTNIIDVHISRLRGKIDRDYDTKLLHTVRGAGYVMRMPVSE
ncbi:MAG: response regulator transcription factor [Marinobacterium sp.]|nr:response regulator transcription factor [Marinobacterium sp.]